MAEPKTLLDVFSSWRQAVPTPALIDARGGVDRRVPAADVARQVAGLAQGLHGLGVSRGDRVALISNNRPEWHIVDFALFHLGAVGVPLYPTLQPAQIGAIVADCGARVIIAENAELLAKVNEARPACPELEHLLVIDSTGEEAARALRECTASLSDAAAAEFLEGCRPSVDAFDLATLIYTSGTTGEPKGVMLTHDNFVFDAVSAATAVPWPSTAEVALVFLPLSHVLERLVDYISFLNGRSLAYCGLLESGDTMRRIRPHFFTAVPRFYEKVQERVLHEVSRAPGWKQALVRAALDEAVESARRGRRRLRYHLYDLLVYSKVRAALGGRVRFSISGGAPLSVAVGELFQGVGINVLEGYGLTETSPVIAVNRHHDPRLGTVGPPIPGVEVRVAPDGEILTRGRHVMKGYWQRPAETRSVLDNDGWLATGDIGELDDDGFLRITDRKKDLLVTAGGKNIAPQPIENQLRASPLIENAVLFGDRRPYVVALIVPAFDHLKLWASAQGIGSGDLRELLGHACVLALFQEVVDATNQKLARFETIKKYRLIAEPFTISGGELTPTLKVKRKVIEQRYGELIDSMYAAG